jgi:hypothetical protein
MSWTIAGRVGSLVNFHDIPPALREQIRPGYRPSKELGEKVMTLAELSALPAPTVE